MLVVSGEIAIPNWEFVIVISESGRSLSEAQHHCKGGNSGTCHGDPIEGIPL